MNKETTPYARKMHCKEYSRGQEINGKFPRNRHCCVDVVKKERHASFYTGYSRYTDPLIFRNSIGKFLKYVMPYNKIRYRDYLEWTGARKVKAPYQSELYIPTFKHALLSELEIEVFHTIKKDLGEKRIIELKNHDAKTTKLDYRKSNQRFKVSDQEVFAHQMKEGKYIELAKKSVPLEGAWTMEKWISLHDLSNIGKYE